MEKTPKESEPGSTSGSYTGATVAGGFLAVSVLAFMVRMGWELAGLVLGWMAR